MKTTNATNAKHRTKPTTDSKHPRGSVLTCLRCDYSWITKKDNPKTCPRCKSYQWEHPRQSA